MTNTAPSIGTAQTRLLDAALHVIRAKGYSAARVDDVCAAAGLSKGAFFHHFASKEDLALAAAGHFSQLADSLFDDPAYRDAVDPLDRLFAYVDLRTTLMQGDLPDFTCLLGTMVQETYDTSPAIRAACDRYIRWHAAAVAKDIAEAKHLHAPRARWTAESLSLHIQATIQGAFILAKASHDPQVAVDSMRHLRRYLEMLFDRPIPRGPTMTPTQKITTFLWFDGNAEEAIAHYQGIFGGDAPTQATRNGAAGPGTPGSFLVGSFELAGQQFIALNGGPGHPVTDAISLSIDCADQKEVDHYWERLSAGGKTSVCGWLQDKFGLSWQVVPRRLPELLSDPDAAKSARAMRAMMA